MMTYGLGADQLNANATLPPSLFELLPRKGRELSFKNERRIHRARCRAFLEGNKQGMIYSRHFSEFIFLQFVLFRSGDVFECTLSRNDKSLFIVLKV